jgi:hypothetical protein
MTLADTGASEALIELESERQINWNLQRHKKASFGSTINQWLKWREC